VGCTTSAVLTKLSTHGKCIGSKLNRATALSNYKPAPEGTLTVSLLAKRQR